MRDNDAGIGNLFWAILDNEEDSDWQAWQDSLNRVVNDELDISDLEEIPVPLKIAS